MRRFTVTTVIALYTVLFVAICSAQQTPTTAIPNLIRYSGTLKDAQGAVPSLTTVGVTFAIYKEQDGGAPVWQETHNVTPDANGQYSIVLGSTTTPGLPNDLFAQQEQRWLGVQVQGQAEQARVLLVSVPYAFKAHEAETLGGLPASAFVKAPIPDGGIGKSVDAPATTASLSSRLKPKDTPKVCTPVPGAITYWDMDGSLCPSNFFQNLGTGNIGIGLTNPSEALDVMGHISTYTQYDIDERRIVAVHTSGISPAPSSTNLFLGWLAGGPNPNTQVNGALNTFSGFSAGFMNNSSAAQGGSNTYSGAYSGYSNTTGLNNTMLGANAGYTNTADFNTCLGHLACQKHGNGNSNTMVGAWSGLNDKAGVGNSFFGYQSGYLNNGNQNTFAGTFAGKNNIGDGNAIFGYQAGFNNSPAQDGNSFFGFQAGMANTSGFDNTFVGYQAGMSNSSSSGNDNTFVGYHAGLSNVIAPGNTFVGSNAGPLSGANEYDGFNTFVGSGAGAMSQGVIGHGAVNNTLLGYRAGGLSTIGFNNTFVGQKAGLNNTIGHDNTFFGPSAGLNNMDGILNIDIGPSAGTAVAPSGNGNILIASLGASADNNTIRIGTEGGGLGQQQKNTFIAGIVSNLTNYASPVPVVTIDINNGHLGVQKISIGGGGNVSAASPFCSGLGSDVNYITKWVTGANTVDCSHIYEDPSTSATPFYVGINVGANPLAALDVNGGSNSGINTTDTRQAYMIGTNPVLSIFPIANNNLFAGVGTGTNGNDNVFVGYNAGNNNGVMATTNTFVGSTSGENNGGTFNSFFGSGAGGGTVGVGANTGNNNVFVGNAAGQSNGSGARNTFVGSSAGTSNLGGNDNVYIGSLAGSANGGGQRNIDIGNPGVSGDFSTIRIGTVQSKTYIGGIYGSAAGNVNRTVCVDSTGKLWSTVSPASQCDGSSRRFKEQIIDMGDRSSKLLALRPVTFLYKPEYDDGLHSLQYGLIAEEVAKVYPDLVEYEKDGQVRTVKYQMLAPMLLNEVQKQHTVVTAQQALVKAQQEQIQTQAQQIQDLQERLLRMESLLENK